MSGQNVKIVISYRRQDSAAVAGRIFDRLVQHYGENSVFMDIDSIPVGADFYVHLQAVLADCDVLLPIIGHAWIGPRDGKPTRIMDESDWVRVEVQTALARGVPVVPVLVEGATLPPAEELPESLHPLLRRNGLEVASGRDFHPHVTRLIASIDRLLTAPPLLSAHSDERSSGGRNPSAHSVGATAGLEATVSRQEWAGAFAKGADPAAQLQERRVSRRAMGAFGIALIIAILLVAGYFIWRSNRLGSTEPEMEAATFDMPIAPAPPQAGARAPRALATAAAGRPVVLTALDDVWIRISQRDGPDLFVGILSRGQRYEVPANAREPQLDTGLPEALAVTVGETAIPQLGPAGRVIDNVSLTAGDLVARVPGAASPGPAAR